MIFFDLNSIYTVYFLNLYHWMYIPAKNLTLLLVPRDYNCDEMKCQQVVGKKIPNIIGCTNYDDKIITLMTTITGS